MRIVLYATYALLICFLVRLVTQTVHIVTHTSAGRPYSDLANTLVMIFILLAVLLEQSVGKFKSVLQILIVVTLALAFLVFTLSELARK